jgi:hypothetical protein
MTVPNEEALKMFVAEVGVAIGFVVGGVACAAAVADTTAAAIKEIMRRRHFTFSSRARPPHPD